MTFAEHADRESDLIPTAQPPSSPDDDDDSSLAEPIVVILDSSSPVITLPPASVSFLRGKFRARARTLPGGTPVHVVDCSWRRTTGVVDFTFALKTVTVTWRELILDLSSAGFPKTCALMVYPADDGVYRLGGEWPSP